MGHAAGAPQHVPDGVAGPHGHPRGPPLQGQPRAQLALLAPLQVVRVPVTAEQAHPQEAQGLQRPGVAVRIGEVGAQGLGGMVHRAHAGGQPDPLRGVHGERRIEDHHPRHVQRVVEALLGLPPGVRAAGVGVELAAGERGGHRHHAHLRTLVLRAVGRAVGIGDHAEGLQAVHIPHLVPQAELHQLARVGERAAPDGDDEVRIRRARLRGGVEHRLPRGVGRHAVVLPREPLAQRRANGGDGVRLPIERAAHHQEHAPRADALRLAGQGLGGGVAAHHTLHAPKGDDQVLHHRALLQAGVGTDARVAPRRWAMQPRTVSRRPPPPRGSPGTGRRPPGRSAPRR